MSKNLLLLVILILLMAFLLGCQGGLSEQETSSFRESIEFVGDIENSFQVKNLEKYADHVVEFEYAGDSYSGIPMQALVEKAEPRADDNRIYFMARDGFSVEITADYLEESFIFWTDGSGWEVVNKSHPVSSNIKEIEKVVLLGGDLPLGEGFSIIEPGQNLFNLSIGELYQNGYSVRSVFRGSSSVSQAEKELEANTYYRKKVVDLEEYVDLSHRENVKIVGEKGEVKSFRQDGFFVIQENRINYRTEEKIKIEDTAGIVLDPPEKQITDVYHDARETLNQDEKIMLILIDGLGYHQYEYAVEKGYAPFLETLPEPDKAMVAYPPVTPVNVAASLTGELPPVNGVYKRGIRQVEVPTIFNYCEENDKISEAVIGPMGTIELEIDPVYSLDKNQDGSTDQQKVENAREKREQELDVIFVHFKDVDNKGHTYGDLSSETMAAIADNDSYVLELVAEWDGQVLIYADHGMHTMEENNTDKKKGDHNSLRTEDMFVPYWYFEGGTTSE